MSYAKSGHVDGGRDGAQVALDLVEVVERVDGGRGDDRVRTPPATSAFACSTTRAVVRSMAPPMTGTRPAAARHDSSHDDVALRVGEVGDLAGRPEHEQAVHALGDEVVHETLEGRDVDLALGRVAG